MNKTSIKLLAFTAGFLLFGILLWAGFVQPMNESVNKAAKEDLVKISLIGGYCIDPTTNMGGVCQDHIKISGTGKITSDSKAHDGTLKAPQLIKLRELITESNLTTLTHNPNAICPSHSDGQDVTFMFPTKYGDQTFTLCQLEGWEEEPLLNYVGQLIEK